jgi:MFS family permease
LKILFPKYGSNALLAKKRGASYIISFISISFFAGLVGSYLLENNFWLLTIAVLGIAGILLCLGRGGGALLGWRKVEEARSTRIKKNAPQIKSRWDYRARKAIREYAGAASAGAEPSKVLSPERFAINSNVWSNNDSLECAAHTFMNLEPMVEDATTKPPLSDHESTVSAYD